MTTCATCAHWGPPVTRQEKSVRKCNAVPMLWNAFDWDDDCSGKALKPEYAGRKAFVQDGSDYAAYLFTTAEFGCNQWEAAPSKEDK